MIFYQFLIMENVKKDSFRAWLLAARPKTLCGAAVPVMIGLALAWADGGRPFDWLAAILCLLFAFVMQIDANFVNDLFDFLKGTDDAQTRLGPERACTQGWVSVSRMKVAIALTTVAACLTGLPLVWIGGWTMVLIGLVCVVFCFLYTTHLSYLGWGDLLVLVFFGFVPVCATYYLQTGRVTPVVAASALACGLVVDTLLLVNNFRDRDTDVVAGKMTLVVKVGARTGLRLYLAAGLVPVLMGVMFLPAGRWWAFLLPLAYLPLHLRTYLKMSRIWQGRALNAILGETARNIFVYGLLFALGQIFSVAI